MLGSNPHPWFHQLGQPLGTMTAAIDACTRTGNGPTSVHRLNPIHHPGTVLGEGRIAPPQLLKGAYSMFFVVHRLDLVGACVAAPPNCVHPPDRSGCRPSSARFCADRRPPAG